MDTDQDYQFRHRTVTNWPRNQPPAHYGSTFPAAPESYQWNNTTGNYSHGYDYENQVPSFQNNTNVELPVDSQQSNSSFATPAQPALFASFESNIDTNFGLPSGNPVVNDAPPSNGDAVLTQTFNEPQSTRRTRYSQADWEDHKPQIKKLYIEEDRSLEDTMKKMSENFGFQPSKKLYKEKIKEWRWPKYLPSSHVSWMKSKKDRRMRLEKKNTEFRVGETVWSAERVEKSAKRAKLSETDGFGIDVETPAGIVYSTPFTVTFSPKMSKAQPTKWTPTAITSPNVQHQNANLCLVWNGHTKAEFEAMHKQAHELDRAGNIEDAEAKFREALEGFEHLLSPTHQETNIVAYHLAEFLAKQARMTEADTVLNWMGEKHFERWGMSHKKTSVHLLRVSEMYQSWSRTEDAISLLSRAMDRLEKVLKSTTQDDEDSDHSTVVEPVRNTPHRTLQSRTSGKIIEPDNDDPDDPRYVEYQLGLAMAQVKAHNATADLLLESLLDKCEEHPEELALQILDVRATLVEHYQRLGESDKIESSVEQAASSFWKVLKSEFKKTPSILEAARKLAELHVKAGHLDAGDTMFHKIESEAVESFGVDDDNTIDVLTAIGAFYQEQGRWDDAEPRFEQALSASMTAYGLESEATVRLETALEKKRYVLHFPNCEDFEAELRKRWTCRRVDPNVDRRRRRFLIDP